MDKLAEHFWAGCAAGELRFQCCVDCNQVQFYPRSVCLQCGSEKVEWKISRGMGTVFSLTRVERAPNDAFRALTPYTLALVDLDEGFRIMAHADPHLFIGDKVALTFFNHDNRALPRFEPA